MSAVLARSVAKGTALAAAGGSGYRRKRVLTYTDACEAPKAMWETGAIPLRTTVDFRDGLQIRTVKKLYEHPAERAPYQLSIGDINGMYCVGNDEIKRYYPEGVGGKAFQLMVPGHPRGFLYRKQSHLLNKYIEKISMLDWRRSVNAGKLDAVRSMSAGAPGLIFDGPTGCGKSSLMAQAVHYARCRNLLTIYVPNAKDWTHGEWCWPSALLPGFWDAPDAARRFLQYFAKANQATLKEWNLRLTPKDLPLEAKETQPTTLFDLCEWGHSVPAPQSIDRQSVAIKFLLDELRAEVERPMLFVIDGYNLFSHETHFRFPHPDFLRQLKSFVAPHTDVEMYPQELPRIPAARLSFVRGLNKMILDSSPNRFFVTATTRDFKPFDGVSGFEDAESDDHRNKLDEYAPYYPDKDSLFYPVPLGDFDEYEYRSFFRFLVNSTELAGSGWGPLWHYSSSFERKLYKVEFMSERNPQRIIDHFHQEITWVYEYERIRQKQYRGQQLEERRAAWRGSRRQGNLSEKQPAPSERAALAAVAPQ